MQETEVAAGDAGGSGLGRVWLVDAVRIYLATIAVPNTCAIYAVALDRLVPTPGVSAARRLLRPCRVGYIYRTPDIEIPTPSYRHGRGMAAILFTVTDLQGGPVGAAAMQAGEVRLAGSASAVLMQPTTLCNLNCSYCYLPDRKVPRRMSVKVAEAVATGVREWSRQHPVTVVWHGGEPLAVDPTYFRSLVEPFGSGETYPVAHAVQTNATRIDETWCEVFSEIPVRVTVSIDGPGEANDSRLDWAGHPSTARAMRGIEMLGRAGISFSMIAVVSDVSSGAASRLFRFACELGCENLGVNLAEKKGVYTGGQEPETGVVAFWQELAASWQDDPRIRVRELDHAYTYIREELSGAAAQRADRPVRPLPLVTWDGHYLPVGAELAGFRSPHHGVFTAGNVLETPLTVLAGRAEKVPWVAEALTGIANCRKQCEHFAYCRGGQVANKYFETGRLDTTETAYCRTSKINLLEGILRHAEHART